MSRRSCSKQTHLSAVPNRMAWIKRKLIGPRLPLWLSSLGDPHLQGRIHDYQRAHHLEGTSRLLTAVELDLPTGRLPLSNQLVGGESHGRLPRTRRYFFRASRLPCSGRLVPPPSWARDAGVI